MSVEQTGRLYIEDKARGIAIASPAEPVQEAIRAGYAVQAVAVDGGVVTVAPGKATSFVTVSDPIAVRDGQLAGKGFKVHGTHKDEADEYLEAGYDYGACVTVWAEDLAREIAVIVDHDGGIPTVVYQNPVETDAQVARYVRVIRLLAECDVLLTKELEDQVPEAARPNETGFEFDDAVLVDVVADQLPPEHPARRNLGMQRGRVAMVDGDKVRVLLDAGPEVTVDSDSVKLDN